MKIPTLSEFEIMCREHDWYYWHSDDHRVFKQGQTQARLLDTIVKAGGDKYKEIFIQYMY